MAEYERALHAIFTAGAEKRRRVRDAAAAALDAAYERCVLGLTAKFCGQAEGAAQVASCSAQCLMIGRAGTTQGRHAGSTKAGQGRGHVDAHAIHTPGSPPTSSPLHTPMCRLQLFGHGTELFAKDEATLAVLQRHLLRSAGAECVDALLRYLAADSVAAEAGQEGEGGGDPALTDASAGTLSAAQRVAVLKDLSPDVKPAASAAVEKLGGASLEVGRWCAMATGWRRVWKGSTTCRAMGAVQLLGQAGPGVFITYMSRNSSLACCPMSKYSTC